MQNHDCRYKHTLKVSTLIQGYSANGWQINAFKRREKLQPSSPLTTKRFFGKKQHNQIRSPATAETNQTVH